MSHKYSISKRAFDVALSFVGLILSSPLWAIISCLIFFEDYGPVFFIQERCGKDGKSIQVIKFRTMKGKVNTRNKLMDIENDPRVTKIGRILRGTAMDELPVLLNILKGDMSFVGPKALPFEVGSRDRYLYAHISEVPGYTMRGSVLPGLTGIAQVYTSKSVSRKEKFHYDNLYIRNRSLWLDIRLILLSFWVTLKGKWESRIRKI